jgi:hypothetical protein
MWIGAIELIPCASSALFGSTPRAHVHFHLCVIEAVLESGAVEAARVHALRLPEEVLTQAQQAIHRRVLRWFTPPPRRHRHRYHGVLAPNGPLRAAVTEPGRGPGRAKPVQAAAQAPTPAESAPTWTTGPQGPINRPTKRP